MQLKNNSFYTLLNFLVAIVPTLKQLWKNSKQVQTSNFHLNDQKNHSLLPEDGDIDELMQDLEEAIAARGQIEPFDLLEFVRLDFTDLNFDVVYTFDRKYEIISYPDFKEEAIEEANCYVYSYDQRRENKRKLGKPALGLSPPFLTQYIG